MADIQFDQYYRYEALTELLEQFSERYPTLCRRQSIGESYEGRDIWLMTVTNFDSGAAEEKPAYWVDGNIHATELSASTAALYLLNKLLTGYAEDEQVRYALDSRVFYIVPRVNPDGAEWALADSPRFIRSSTKPYPREDQLDGLISQDIDGDGRILQMRLPDEHGNWKPHPDEPRLMVRREAYDLPGGDYYRLLPEGLIQNYDGVLIKAAPALQGLDLNRNFPGRWTPKQGSGGRFAGSESEVMALIEFITTHPNITGGLTFHTFSGVHLRPPTAFPDSELPTADLRVFKMIGERGKALTGYPAIGVFQDFAYDPKTPTAGTFDDWMYEHLGVYAWTTEIWSPQRQSGIENDRYIEWFQDHPAEHDLQILRWFEENIKAESHIDWYPYDHPQLGAVEIGGWNVLHTWRNPPLEVLEAEVAPLAEFCIHNCLISPKLELLSLDVESHGELHTIRLVVHNTGWLPTQISEQALKMKAAKPLEVDIDLPQGVRLISGERKIFADQLNGRSHKGAMALWSADVSDNRAKFEWVVQAESGTQVTISAKHDRAGAVRRSITLS